MIDMVNKELEERKNHFDHTESSNNGIGSLEFNVSGVTAYYDKKGELQSNLDKKGKEVAEEISKKPWFSELIRAIRTNKVKGHYGPILGGLGFIIFTGLVGVEAKRGWKDLKQFVDWIEPHINSKEPPQE